ncbi:CocE/NonD family hydrolase (plasmid) [Polymorphobacter sp. PAMC 29334]|uniref:CocE/NonD family hydrolase n=1 Tax=Polymorphobacter sp. PAMC 29334 TaxID=2862331 RepID=UPI001C7592AE|nr:CocE/NonD family hydrolase [Polymorphobacter sp. PAMC 29334]QYE37107.1 CocE/NonD family hydrolase [Polymorphobacter sp. PAMC 29334]
MPNDLPIYVPAYPDSEDSRGLFSGFEPGIRTLPAGFQVSPNFLPLPVDIVMEKDVAVTLRDGVTIYVDVLRPSGSARVPVIVAWSPYGKSRGNAAQYVQLFGLLGMDTRTLSGLMKFEGPDPAYWCAHGYAVCNPDPRGAYGSEGDIRVWSREEGEDFHDLIEWLGVQEWCNGKVGTSGNSYLAISQWFAAAEQPPHLAAIAPWEGMSDIYRDLVMRGGIPDLPFPRRLATAFVGNNNREDLVAEAEAHPLMDTLWISKIPDFERITVPAYVVASYSNSIHTPGTFRGWRRMGSEAKWLRIHNTMEWPDYYEEANANDLLRFFDRYLKDIENGWESTPRVRYSVLDLEGGDEINRPADEFPPHDAVETRYYLDATSGSLITESPTTASSAAYDTGSEGCVSFVFRVEAPIEFVGYPKATLWVETDGSDDMDVFVFLQKLNADGVQLEQFNVPNQGPQMQAVTKDGAAILKYKGSNGRLRASMRRLDESQSTDAIPVHSFDRVEKLALGEVVRLDIDLFPIGLALQSGEQLRLVVAGHHILGGVMPGNDNVTAENRGRHVIHTGGGHASHLQICTRSRRDD